MTSDDDEDVRDLDLGGAIGDALDAAAGRGSSGAQMANELVIGLSAIYWLGGSQAGMSQETFFAEIAEALKGALEAGRNVPLDREIN